MRLRWWRRPRPCDLGMSLHPTGSAWVYECHTHGTLFVSGTCPGSRP